jgi:ATP-dependent Clp protease, protease subunit
LKNKKFWQFKAKENNSGDLMLYGDIASTTWWGDEITPKDFKSDLDSLGDIQTLNIYINSDGGDVFAGQAIYSMLKRHPATKNIYIDGLAASIASLIAMAGDKIIMPANAMMMVHRAWTVAMGNANDFRKMAEDMDKIDESIVTVYEAKTGMKQEDIISLLDAETWLTAQDALDNGFCDEIEEEKQVAASLKGDFLNVNGVDMDLKRFKNAPKLGFIPKALDETVQDDASTNEDPTEEYKENEIPAEQVEPIEYKNEDEDELRNKAKIESIKAKLALECEL